MVNRVSWLEIKADCLELPYTNSYVLKRPLVAASAVFNYQKTSTSPSDLLVTAKARVQLPLKKQIEFLSSTRVSFSNTRATAFAEYREVDQSVSGRNRVWNFDGKTLVCRSGETKGLENEPEVSWQITAESQEQVPILNPLMIHPALQSIELRADTRYFSLLTVGRSLYALGLSTQDHTVIEGGLMKVRELMSKTDLLNLSWQPTKHFQLIRHPSRKEITDIVFELPVFGSLRIRHE